MNSDSKIVLPSILVQATLEQLQRRKIELQTEINNLEGLIGSTLKCLNDAQVSEMNKSIESGNNNNKAN